MMLPISQESIPVPVAGSGDGAVGLSGKEFKSLRRVLPFASRDNTRPVLTSVWMRIVEDGDGSAVLADCADGFSLARMKLKIPKAAPMSVMLPAAFVGSVIKHVADDDEVRFWADDNNQMIISTQTDGRRITFASLLIDGQYPDTNALMEKEAPGENATAQARVAMPALERVTRRARIIDAPGIIFQFGASDEAAELRTLSSKEEGGEVIGETKDVIATGDDVAGEAKLALATNILGNLIEAGEAKLLFRPGVSPVKPAWFSTDDLEILVMPLHVGDMDKIDLFAVELDQLALVPA
jgi:DNA polymerase III sliding clamp (beta) subunit (PCNA family)